MTIDWSKVISAAERQAQAQQALLDAIATRRYQAETAGFVYNDLTIRTDERSQNKLVGAALAATQDPNYVAQWKTPAGFVNLDAPTLIAAATAMRDHIQACFDREAELVAAVEDGSYTPDMVDQGWP